VTVSTTPNRGYHWPNNDEPVTNGWDAIRDLAVDVDLDVKATREAPYAKAYSTVDYGTVNGGTTHTVSVNMVDLEEAGGLTHAAGIFTVPSAGIYMILAAYTATPLTAPHDGVQTWIGKNGTAQILGQMVTQPGGANFGNGQQFVIHDILRLAANDTLRLCAQGVGGQTTFKTAQMAVCKLRD
jgi:hypothetical protein